MAKQTKIITYPNKSLSTPTKEWDFSLPKEELMDILAALEEVLKAHPEGIAISANQIGLTTSVFIIEEKTATKWDIPRIIINPILKPIEESDNILAEEGCLSFPSVYIKVKRRNQITCDYDDEEGLRKTLILEGYPSRIFQHECEHLNGKTFIDRLTRIKKYQIIGEMKNRKG